MAVSGTTFLGVVCGKGSEKTLVSWHKGVGREVGGMDVRDGRMSDVRRDVLTRRMEVKFQIHTCNIPIRIY